ncbi:MAG: TIGR04283 family arsenosugar biosynthesis glycosyltransferase [Nitrospirae bacterium]|nr:TIGR04283 family arsenosugar biosynthesis glycosyltransferase [Nitrospirota bacterium]
MVAVRPLISIIVPVLDESATLAATLHPLVGVPDSELIIVDGGSRDGTVTVAGQFTGEVFQGARGRANQMNFGALQAKGEILLFLHGDTALPSSALDMVRRTLDDQTVAGGAFRLRIASPCRVLKIIAWGANLRSRYFGLPYGDQALFVRRTVFETIGGFAPWPLMEDVDLVRRIKRVGRVALLPDAVTTSARRWEREGVLWTTARNSLLLAGFWLGIPPAWLAQWYRVIR